MTWNNTGSITTVTAANYTYFRQDLLSSCGRAAVLTLIYYIQNKQLSPSIVGRWFREFEGSLHVGNNGIRDFVNAGSNRSSVIGVLSKLGIYATYTNHIHIKNHISRISRAHPAILSVGWYIRTERGWRRNGGHWVVAVEIIDGHIICLDPGLENSGNTIPLTAFPTVISYNQNHPPKLKYGAYNCTYQDHMVTGYIDGLIQT